MSLRSRALFQGRPTDASVYRKHFLRRIHCLIGRGFQRISSLDLSRKEEPAITGLLTEAIESFFDDPQSPNWVDRFSIQDERHLNESDREGKRRFRVDIELIGAGVRPRPRFQIEAKRLQSSPMRSVKKYLDSDGLGSFLSGRYAGDQPFAGMMGYVQTGTAGQWAGHIRTAIEGRSDELAVVPDTEVFSASSLDESLPDVYRSDHFRQEAGHIEIHHILLPCLRSPDSSVYAFCDTG